MIQLLVRLSFVRSVDDRKRSYVRRFSSRPEEPLSFSYAIVPLTISYSQRPVYSFSLSIQLKIVNNAREEQNIVRFIPNYTVKC